MKALFMASILCGTVVAAVAYSKANAPGADIRNPKTLTKIYYDRLPEFTCPHGQLVVWKSAREIGCEA